MSTMPHASSRLQPDTRGWTPEELFNPVELTILASHIQASKAGKRGKTADPQKQQTIVKMLDTLIAHGYWADKVDKNGRIIWSIRCKGQVQVEMEKGLLECEKLFRASGCNPHEYMRRLRSKATTARADAGEDDAWKSVGDVFPRQQHQDDTKRDMLKNEQEGP